MIYLFFPKLPKYQKSPLLEQTKDTKSIENSIAATKHRKED